MLASMNELEKEFDELDANFDQSIASLLNEAETNNGGYLDN